MRLSKIYIIVLYLMLGLVSCGFCDTAGNTTIGDGEGYYYSGVMDAICFFTMPVSGTLNSIKLCASLSTGTFYLKMAIYTDNAGTPKDLVGGTYTNPVQVTRTSKPTQDSEWTVGTPTATVVLTGGQVYWIVFTCNSNSIRVWQNVKTGSGKTATDCSYATFPGTAFPTVVTTDNAEGGSYIVYTPSGGSVVDNSQIITVQ